MTRDIGLSAEVVTTLTEAFARFPAIEKVKLYGSRAKGNFSARSDIDLVAYGKGVDRHLISRVLMDLDDSDISYLVDLQNFHDLTNQQLIEHINRVGLVIYQAQHLRELEKL